MVGIYELIFIRKELKGRLSNKKIESVGTGLLNQMGNKGGVGARMNVDLNGLEIEG